MSLFNICLLFKILQVNGKDVSNLAHEEAVNEFLKASEPIVVEVRRRYNNDTDTDSSEQSAQKQKQQRNEQHQLMQPQQTINNTDSSRTINDPLITTSSIEKPPTSLTQTPLNRNETISIGVQTDFLLCNSFENDYIFVSNDSPISDGNNLNSQINQNSRQNNSSSSSSCNNNNNNNNNGSSNLHHPLHHHCNMLNECIVPPEIDIEVIFNFILFLSFILDNLILKFEVF